MKRITIISFCCIIILLTMICFEISIASGDSMRPTLKYSDHIVYIKLYRNINRHNIVELTPPASINNPLHSDRYKKILFNIYWDKERRKLGSHKFALIKRVIGLPGELIEIKDKQVYINNAPLYENYTQFIGGRPIQWLWDDGTQSSQDDLNPITIPDDYYFVMGDNRDVSKDSRAFGFIHKDAIKAKALFILYSCNETDGVMIKRMFKGL